MKTKNFQFIQLGGKRVRHYCFESHENGYHQFHLYVNLKENIFQIIYTSNEEVLLTDIDMSYKPKAWLESLWWSLSLLDCFSSVAEFLDSVAYSLEYHKKCPHGLKMSNRFVKHYDLERFI